MSERPTPETDSLERCQYIYWGADGDALQKLRIDALDEMKSLARKLERERDEAREQSAKLRNIAERILLNCETLHPNTVKLHRAELAQLKEGAQ